MVFDDVSYEKQLNIREYLLVGRQRFGYFLPRWNVQLNAEATGRDNTNLVVLFRQDYLNLRQYV